ncbi:hypothetical protein AB9P05_23815 [Roseivirga sp. BDSF3-8]|uniref:hypothetical protein n=1 Tax=Roseivirga sp. BDSF3-8 TaxID=3241598 RepID=UPI0035324E91
MKVILLSFIALCMSISVEAFDKSDTLYIYFKSHPNFTFQESEKHSQDPNPSMEYPYHGGMNYFLTLNGSQTESSILFYYSSYMPQGLDSQPGYIQVDSAYLEKQDWYTTEQLLGMSKTELIRTFDKRPSELVIMLLDENYMDTEPYILTRVYLYYSAEE